MASGTITLTRTGSGYLSGRIVWSSTSNGTFKNTSTVVAKLQIKRNASNTTYGTFSGTFTVGNTTVSVSSYQALANSWVTIKTITATINHNANGTGSCYIYAKVNGPGGTTMEGTSVKGSSTVALDTIPRYASAVSATSFTDEENPVLTYSNPAGETVDELKACISLDGSTEPVSCRELPKTGTSYTFQLTDAERSKLREATPNSNSLALWFVVYTLIGEASGASVKPGTMSIVNGSPVVNPSVVDTNADTVALTGDSNILVALHSNASVTVNATAQKYAKIPSNGVKVEHGSITLSGDGTLAPVTNDPILITVTDSRNNVTVKTASNTIIPYVNPTSQIENSMPDATGNLDLTATGIVYDGSFGASNNVFSIKYRYKEGYGEYTDWVSFDEATLDGNHYTATAAVTGLNYQSTYTFQTMVVDSLNPDGVMSEEKKFVSVPAFDWSENDFRFHVPVVVDKNLHVASPMTVVGESFPTYTIKKTIDGDELGGLAYDAVTNRRFYFLQYAADMDGVPARYGENFSLPVPASGLTDHKWYQILTSKNPVTVEQGGTGANTAEQALLNLGGVKLVKLWENASPTSTFYSQTVSLDLGEYDLVSIYYKNIPSGAVYFSTGIVPVGSRITMQYVSTSGAMYHRHADVSASGIAFSAGQMNGEASNTAPVPVVVYGWKGVQ